MKLGLAFSGGKDSWACLLLYRDRLDDITVLWANTGKNYPEMLASVEVAKAMCPNFVEIKSDQAAQNSREGLPADVVPINWTRLGMSITGIKPTAIQSYLNCCYENIAKPIRAAAKELGITHIISGQRSGEQFKSTSVDGDIVDGVTCIHPVEGWSEKEVLDFVGLHMELPENFKLKHTSMDCYDCTAFRGVTKDRVAYTAKHHPELHAEHQARTSLVNTALVSALGE